MTQKIGLYLKTTKMNQIHQRPINKWALIRHFNCRSQNTILYINAEKWQKTLLLELLLIQNSLLKSKTNYSRTTIYVLLLQKISIKPQNPTISSAVYSTLFKYNNSLTLSIYLFFSIPKILMTKWKYYHILLFLTLTK